MPTNETYLEQNNEVLKRRVKELEEALRPLAEIAAVLSKHVGDDVVLWGETSNFRKAVRLTLGDARRAAEVLEKK